MPQMTAREEIPRLLEQLLNVAHRAISARVAFNEIERLTDEISTKVDAACSFIDSPVDRNGDQWKAYRLTRQEARMIGLLYDNRGQIVKKSALLGCSEQAICKGYKDGDKLVEVKICDLRKKLAGSPYRIKTHIGFGYEMELA